MTPVQIEEKVTWILNRAAEIDPAAWAIPCKDKFKARRKAATILARDEYENLTGQQFSI